MNKDEIKIKSVQKCLLCFAPFRWGAHHSVPPLHQCEIQTAILQSNTTFILELPAPSHGHLYLRSDSSYPPLPSALFPLQDAHR